MQWLSKQFAVDVQVVDLPFVVYSALCKEMSCGIRFTCHGDDYELLNYAMLALDVSQGSLIFG